ncbi:hypothetical protein H4582DRAFT_1980841, partial [Lactarius indigo]
RFKREFPLFVHGGVKFFVLAGSLLCSPKGPVLGRERKEKAARRIAANVWSTVYSPRVYYGVANFRETPVLRCTRTLN